MRNLAIDPAERAALRASGLLAEPVSKSLTHSKATRVAKRIRQEITWLEHARHCLPPSADKDRINSSIDTLKRVQEWIEDPAI